MWLDFRFIFNWLLLISYFTDAIDNCLARRLKITSPRGSELDSYGN
ncbi:CDP-alcohol phosphatidyltransferase family protein [Yeosuana marina]